MHRVPGFHVSATAKRVVVPGQCRYSPVVFALAVDILSPLVLLIVGGFLMATFFTISEETLVRVVSDFFMPLLIFHAVYRSTLEAREILSLGAAVALVTGLLLLLAAAYAGLTGVDRRAFSLPVVFMNSGSDTSPITEEPIWHA